MVLWDVMPCNLVGCYKCFVGTALSTVRVGCYILVYRLKLWVATVLLLMYYFILILFDKICMEHITTVSMYTVVHMNHCIYY